MSDKKNVQAQVGWAKLPISELLTPLEDGRTLHQGWSPRCEKEPSGTETEWGVLKTTSIQPAVFLPEYNKRLPEHLAPRPQLEVKPGDILITCAGPRNRCGIACLVRATRRRLMMSGKMYRFRPDSARVDSRYLEAYLQSADAQAAIDEMKTGGNESGLNLTHARFRKLLVPVAPLDQQKRIVAEIEKQFSRLDEAVANLKRVKANLKRYKAAVLKAAVEGRLVETEAELARREGRRYETGEQLLQRILETRRSQWQGKGKGKGKYKEPAAPDTTDLPELPEGWVWVTTSQVLREVKDGTHDTPKYHETGVPFITQKHVKAAGFVFDDFSRISLEDHEHFFKRSNPERGDILVSMIGVNRGESCIVDTDEVFSIKNVGLLKPDHKTSSVKFVQYYLSSTLGQRLILRGSKGGAQPFVGLSELRNWPLPVPPYEEQHSIVAEVDRRLSLIDETAAQVDANLKRAERLRQSVLEKAFCGGFNVDNVCVAAIACHSNGGRER